MNEYQLRWVFSDSGWDLSTVEIRKRGDAGRIHVESTGGRFSPRNARWLKRVGLEPKKAKELVENFKRDWWKTMSERTRVIELVRQAFEYREWCVAVLVEEARKFADSNGDDGSLGLVEKNYEEADEEYDLRISMLFAVLPRGQAEDELEKIVRPT